MRKGSESLRMQVIAKHMGDFIVTPKDIDVIVEDMAGNNCKCNKFRTCSGTISSRCGICLRN